MLHEECCLIELEILDFEGDEFTLDVDFAGEIVSGSTGEEYQNGYNKGISDGYKDGHEAGYTEGHKDGYDEAKAENDSYYDIFWDNFQQNGERTSYAHAFAYGWNEDNFYPKYDINPQSGESMFAYFLGEIDLEQKLKECGVILDTKNCTNLNYAFWHSNLETIPVIDCSSVSTLNRTFAYCEKLKTIRKNNMEQKYNI